METRRTLLVVDDDPHIQSLLQDFLGSLGYVVLTAGDGEQALQLLRQHPVHAVLADLQLPKLGGLELLREIKAVAPGLPTIVITGYPSVEVAVEAMKEGAVDFVTKPMSLDQLELLLDKVLNGTARWRAEGAASPVSLPRPTPPASPLHGKVKELSILYAISESFQSATDIEEIFQCLVQTSREIGAARYSSFTILDREAEGSPLKVVRAGEVDPQHPAILPLDPHMLGRLLAERQPLLYNHGQPGVVIPVFIKDELLGVLRVGAKPDEQPYTEDEVFLLLTLCRRAALSLENQFLYESLYQSLLETLKALVTTLEAKDPYTRAHSLRVSRYATAMAARMGCTQEEQDIVKVAGFLHDIGKVGICDAILLKPDRLTPGEYEVIKTHPVIGEQIVQHLGYFTREKTIIRHHHEWWDGRGYPDGLAKDHIPFLARILAVADAYDAITTDRPYRAGKSYREGIEELQRWIGIQFDREAVVAFRHVMAHDPSLTAARHDRRVQGGSLHVVR